MLYELRRFQPMIMSLTQYEKSEECFHIIHISICTLFSADAVLENLLVELMQQTVIFFLQIILYYLFDFHENVNSE